MRRTLACAVFAGLLGCASAPESEAPSPAREAPAEAPAAPPPSNPSPPPARDEPPPPEAQPTPILDLYRAAMGGDLAAVDALRTRAGEGALDALCRLLANAPDAVCTRAAEALRTLGPPADAFACLVAAIERGLAPARLFTAVDLAAAALGGPLPVGIDFGCGGFTPAEMLQLLADARGAAGERLAPLQRVAGPRLAALAADATAQAALRRLAIALLGRIGGPDAETCLLGLIRDPAADPSIREAAGTWLPVVTSDDTTASLDATLSDATLPLDARLQAALVLASLPGEAARQAAVSRGVPLAREVLDGPRDDLHPAALAVLAAAAPDAARDRARALLAGAASYRVRARAAEVLGETGDASDAARLDASARGDPSMAVRQAAETARARLIARLGGA